MTSMPLTLRTIFLESINSCLYRSAALHATLPIGLSLRIKSAMTVKKSAIRSRSGLAVRGSAPRHLLVSQVFVCAGLDHGFENLLVSLVPIRGRGPFAAVPILYAGPGRAHMILARRAERAHDAVEAQRVKLLLVQRQILQPPTHLLGGHDLALAKALLGPAHSFHGQHRNDNTACVKHRADFVFRSRALALAMHIFCLL